jgi:hypothetical protein
MRASQPCQSNDLIFLRIDASRSERALVRKGTIRASMAPMENR